MAMVMVTALSWLAGFLLYLAQDWIVNWDAKRYQDVEGDPFPDPLRLKEYSWYGWTLSGCIGGPIVFWAIWAILRSLFKL